MGIMEGMTALGVVFMVVVLPVWLFFHYLAKMKTNRGLTAEDEKMLVELWETARKMEQRIESLETILTEKVPDWRESYEKK
ncbi:MAG: envelope stress response membrane protein PspB [Gammaproteobacteria bacterium]|nr:envelope stress response membrane protein PspB [Gammaproteobacteria bacterium]